MADRAAGVAADRDRAHVGGDGDRAAAAAAAGHEVFTIWIAGLLERRRLGRRAHAELVHVGAAEQQGVLLLEAVDQRSQLVDGQTGRFELWMVDPEMPVLIEMDNFTKDYAFVGKEKLLYFNGWLKLYGKQNSQIDSNSVVSKYAKIKPKPSKFEGHNVWTNPPARYNESSIIDKLEKSGVGRPSTYASIMNKLFEKQYIEKRDIVGTEKEHIDYTIEASAWSLKSKKTSKMVGDENKRLIPTDIGKVVDAFVADNFKNIVDIEFTSSMEDSLDKIANQTLDYKTFLKAFYKNFHVDFTRLQSKLNLGDKSKGQIGKEEELLYSEKEYMVVKRTTRYGPVIEKRFLKEDEKSEYINLERYLQDTDKTLAQITKEDANLMLRLPLDIMHTQNTPYQLRYGRYGFYLINMKDKTTLSIFKPYVKYVLDLNIKELFENTVNKSKANTKKKNKN